MDAPSRRHFGDGEMAGAVISKVAVYRLQASLPDQPGQPHTASCKHPLNRTHGDVVRGSDLLQAQFRVLQVSVDIRLDFMPEELSHVLGAGLIILQDYTGQQCFTGRGQVVPRCRAKTVMDVQALMNCASTVPAPVVDDQGCDRASSTAARGAPRDAEGAVMTSHCHAPWKVSR